VGKRRRFSRWRRLPPVYRIGDDKPADPNLEPERLTLYVNAGVFDRAEAQARRHGFESVQEYCTQIVLKAVDAEHVRDQVAGVEARRGALEGLNEIADDPEYLAELSAASAPREHPVALERGGEGHEAVTVRLERAEPDPGGEPEIVFEPVPSAPSAPARMPGPTTAGLSPSAWAVIRHAGQGGGDDDPRGFLPCLRRGEPVAPEEVGDLARALGELERECRGIGAIDRRLSFALHRLAFESQILHTDAWPGSFDAWTVDMLRAVQEAVERILSGQDIRYYPDAVVGADHAPTRETPP